jgi:hypothetical protein
MCLIIDNNLVRPLLLTGIPDYTLIRNAVLGGKCCLSYGGRLRREYQDSPDLMRFVLQLDRAGKAKAFPDSTIDDIEQMLLQRQLCISDDPHVIGLAQVSGARLLCTDDVALQSDFRNAALLNSPRGNVFKNPSHRHLIRRLCHPC